MVPMVVRIPLGSYTPGHVASRLKHVILFSDGNGVCKIIGIDHADSGIHCAAAE